MKFNKLVFSVSLLLFFLVTWQLGITLKSQLTPEGTTSIEAFIPTPFTIFHTLRQKAPVIFQEFSYTIIRSIGGLFVGIICAISVNFAFWFFPSLKKVVFPLSLAINSFPIIGFSPLIIMTFGQGSWGGIVFISALISYFPILISLENGLSGLEKDFHELGKTWGASKVNLYRNVQLPLLFPYLLGSLRLAVPASIVGATLGEWLGSNHGIGRLVVISLYQLNPGLLYACLLSLLAFSLLLTYLVTHLSYKLFPWLSK